MTFLLQHQVLSIAYSCINKLLISVSYYSLLISTESPMHVKMEALVHDVHTLIVHQYSVTYSD